MSKNEPEKGRIFNPDAVVATGKPLAEVRIHDSLMTESRREIESLRASLRATEEALAVAEKALTWGRDLVANCVADPDNNIDAFDSEQFLKEANAALSALKNKPALAVYKDVNTAPKTGPREDVNERVRVARERLLAHTHLSMSGGHGCPYPWSGAFHFDLLPIKRDECPACQYARMDDQQKRDYLMDYNNDYVAALRDAGMAP